MAWNDRLREAAYTSPNGNRFVFTYEDVSKEIDKKTSVFMFPDKDGAFVQDLGRGGRRFPMRVIFWGENYDLQANLFEIALEEKGIGKLDHPNYGVKNVVPFGTITRRDDLKTSGNQAIFDVTFYETLIDIIFPESTTNIEQQLLDDIEEFQEVVSAEYAQELAIATSLENVNTQNVLQLAKAAVGRLLGTIAKVQSEINARFQAIFRAINDTITNVVTKPLQVASQSVQLIKTPARIAINVRERLRGYSNIIRSLGSSIQNIGFDNSNKNAFLSNRVYVNGALTSAVEATLFYQYLTKDEALDSIDTLTTLYDEVKEWEDANIQSLELIDQGESYNSVLGILTQALSRLIALSFTLKEERILTLDRNESFIPLSAKLYKNLDELDFFIASNNLTGDEILELPIGKEIVYYI